MTEFDTLRDRAEALHLHGLVSHWPEVATEAWVAPLLEWEETQRACRSLQRRLKTAHIGRFKPLCDFDWNWPKRCDRAAVDALMALDFLCRRARSNQGQALRVAAKAAASLDRPCARRLPDLAVGTEECSRRGSNQRIAQAVRTADVCRTDRVAKGRRRHVRA
jgi:hypothetical protein